MKRTLVMCFLASALLFAACSGTNGCRFTGETDAVFAEWDRTNSPGCTLAVIKDGEIVYSRGYGMADLEHDVPIGPETVFYIGSESKQFVAACLLLLEEQGKLSLDDDIRKYVPELPSYGAPITIRHCILHTSGLRDYFTLWSLAGIDYADFHPEMEVVDLIARQKELNFPPGEDRLYSNSGYLLLS
ncbi:MAG: beta-lactamase family protein, partial [Candidatus Latescibacteria bacterium]|nr:beta-lactamase family protein [Candidatus Latescibacterota bacterium]